MENFKNSSPSRPLPPSFRPSFREAISRAREQVDADTLPNGKDYDEIYAIIAEVFMMSAEHPIRISGEWLDGYMVKEVFSELTREHVEMVIDEFKRLTSEIRNTKAYLRTSLYNSVFSLSTHYTNKVNHDFAHYYDRANNDKKG